MEQLFDELKMKIYRGDDIFVAIARLMKEMSDLKKPMTFPQQMAHFKIVLANPITAKMYEAFIEVGFTEDRADEFADKFARMLFTQSGQ